MSNPLLYVNRKDLALAASLLKKIVRPSKGLEVVLKFDGKELQIEAGGGSSSAAAHGVWPGSAPGPHERSPGPPRPFGDGQGRHPVPTGIGE